MMFVPGNKPSMIEKAAKAKADALILDLEDSVPPAERLKARELIVSRLSWLAEQRQRIYVRINRSPARGSARRMQCNPEALERCDHATANQKPGDDGPWSP